MGVAVYPRLDELLRSGHLTVAELARRIEKRFGLRVDPKTLYRLASMEAIQRPDLVVAGAAAAVPGVGLGDLFDVRVTPVEDDGVLDAQALATHESQGLVELLDLQSRAQERHSLSSDWKRFSLR